LTLPPGLAPRRGRAAAQRGLAVGVSSGSTAEAAATAARARHRDAARVARRLSCGFRHRGGHQPPTAGRVADFIVMAMVVPAARRQRRPQYMMGHSRRRWPRRRAARLTPSARRVVAGLCQLELERRPVRGYAQCAVLVFDGHLQGGQRRAANEQW